MPLGNNAGGNLNIFIFEVGMVKTLEAFGIQTEIVRTVGIHPLLVVPKKVAVKDSSRTAVMQTVGGSIETKGGRALRTCTMEGTFGVDNRGLLFYLGTGAVRFKRFYNEVVRMPDALTGDDVDDATKILTGTPGITLLTAGYDEDNTNFFINYFDFFNDISFQAKITQFNWSREYAQGGASGLVHYTMTIDEVGPIVSGTFANTILSILMNGLTAWDDLNNVIESYTLTAINESLTNFADILVREWEDTLAAVQVQIASVQGLMGSSGSSGGTGSDSGVASDGTVTDTGISGVDTFFQQADTLASLSDELANNISSLADDEIGADLGLISWAEAPGQGGSATLTSFEAQVSLLNLSTAATRQQVMGIFYGMGREDFQAFITSGGNTTAAPPELAGTFTHIVSDTDTPDTISSAYGVPWRNILALNRLLPDEALLVLTRLDIPRIRPRGPQGIDGLPTFGSHVGQAAWGSDLDFELTAADNGDLLTVESGVILDQGIRFMVEHFGDSVLDAAQNVPDEVREDFIAQRFGAIFGSDKRIKSISGVDVDIDGSGAVSVGVTLLAINGGKVRVSGAGR